jgi:prolipoprotein diacylglyceryltransferase
MFVIAKPAPTLAVAGRRVPAFQVFGVFGIVGATALSMLLAALLGRSPWIVAAMALAAVLVAATLAMATKVASGEEQLAYYHYAAATVGVATALLVVTGEPIVAYLDIVAVGFAALNVPGRMGCLSAGCCHGRPHRWGVRYDDDAASEGFPEHLVGVTLLPVQAAESALSLFLVVAGSAWLLLGAQPGNVLALSITVYAVGRFALEFLRGDSPRRYVLGFSEAQWTSVSLSIAVAATMSVKADLLGLLYTAPAAVLVAALGAVALHRKGRTCPTHRLLHPHHISEVAAASAEAFRISSVHALDPAEPEVVAVGETSLGIRISAGAATSPLGPACHYGISSERGELTPRAADVLAGLIVQLRHLTCTYTVVSGGHGVYHLVVVPPPRTSAAA